jgi:CheY-like chemotaxis protein
MDVNMPRMDGIEATQRLTEAHPKSVVVLVPSKT